jgi:hypothetical protein
MNKNELLRRERLDPTSGPLSKIANAQTARVLQSDELDAVSGGYTLSNTMISGYAVSRGVVRLMENDGIDGALY